MLDQNHPRRVHHASPENALAITPLSEQMTRHPFAPRKASHYERQSSTHNTHRA